MQAMLSHENFDPGRNPEIFGSAERIDKFYKEKDLFSLPCDFALKIHNRSLQSCERIISLYDWIIIHLQVHEEIIVTQQLIEENKKLQMIIGVLSEEVNSLKDEILGITSIKNGILGYS